MGSANVEPSFCEESSVLFGPKAVDLCVISRKEELADEMWANPEEYLHVLCLKEGTTQRELCYTR